MKNVFIHETAIVETDEIGEGSRVWAYVHIMAGSHIGKNCNIGDHCFIEPGAFVGDNATVKNGNMIWEGVTLEDGVFVGPHVFFTNDLYPRSPRLPQSQRRYADKRQWLVPTVVKRGASLGASAVILAGVTIGEYSMIGAGALVAKDVPSHALLMGNPGKVRGWVCQCGRPIHFSKGLARCAECGLRFYNERGVVRVADTRRKTRP